MKINDCLLAFYIPNYNTQFKLFINVPRAKAA